MSPPDRRRFTLLDAMILVAATAIGLALLRVSLRPFLYLRQDTVPRGPIGQGLTWTFAAAFGLSPLLASWTITILFLGLRGRQRRRRIPPGILACAAATLGFGLVAMHIVDSAIWGVRWSGVFVEADSTLQVALGNFWQFLDHLSFDPFHVHSVGYAVSGAWLALALGRRWRTEPTWADRTGRILGIYWTALVPLYMADGWIQA